MKSMLGNEPVFPLAPENVIAYNGLTKRELFAAMAMQGFMANTKTAEALASTATTEGFASASVYAADALLKKLESP